MSEPRDISAAAVSRTELSGQRQAASAFQAQLARFLAELDRRKPAWDKLSDEKRRAWLAAAEVKDPLLWKAFQLRGRLNDWFGDINEE